jgi:predicted RNA-binding protein YlqC (UPF0109 family)
MSSIDEQFVDYIVKSLVGNPDAVSIHRSVDEKGVLLELTVDPEDLGRIIGKRGATAQSLRTLLRALGTKNDARYNLKIIDNGPQDGHRDAAPVAIASDDSTAPAAPSDDTTATDEPAEDTTTPTSVVDDDNEEPEVETKDDDHSDALRKTRAELEDLDDLDI